MARKDQHMYIEGLSDIVRLIDGLGGEAVTGELLEEIGFYLTNAILARTASGRGVDGRLFEPYSPKYRLFRMEKGHPVNVVNLFFHGSMLSSLTHTVFNDRVELFFMNTYGKTPRGDASKISNPQKAFFLNQDRRFFAISEKERSDISHMLQVHIQRLIDRE